MDWKLELVFVPVSDVDRAKDFYVNKVGFNADFDERPSDSARVCLLHLHWGRAHGRASRHRLKPAARGQ